MRQKKLVKGLTVFILIFSLIFFQSLIWVHPSLAQDTSEGNRRERPKRPERSPHDRTVRAERHERPERPERPERSERPTHESSSHHLQGRSWFQREGQKPSSQSSGDSEPSPTPTPNTNPQPIDDSQTTESQPDESSDSAADGEQVEPSGSVENQDSPDDPLNENTGPFSENIAWYEKEEKISIFNINDIWIENNIDSFVNTGWNRANYNTGHGAIDTGQAYAWASLQTKANTNSTSIPTSFEDDPASPAVVQNEITGSESSNLAESEILSELEIINENNFETINEIGIMSNTGGNEAMFNTGNGMIASGDAQAAVDLVINANSNFVNSDESLMSSFSLFGENTGDLDFSNFGQTPVFENNDEAPTDGFVEENLSYLETDSPVLASNTTTGPDSENYTILEATSSAKILNDNQAVVENDVLVAATTGDNTSSYNTGHGIVESGDADLIANVVNFINTNIVDSEVILATINVFGEWIGDFILPTLELDENSPQEATIVASNENTGPNSFNEATISIDSEFEVTNVNDGVIINDLKPEANTGENQAEHNTGAALIETGDVSAQGSIASIANTNITNANPILLIINTLGEWVGEIITPDGTVSHQPGEQDVLVYSTFGEESVNFADGPVTLVESFNEDTGPNSENIAETDIEKNTLIENSNDFVIENNISLLADTGGNEASSNTGQGMIKSGDANLATNLVNFVNTNITGGKVIVAVINVFGEWWGNILAPNNPEEDSDDQETNTGNDFNSVADFSDPTDNLSFQDSNGDNPPEPLDNQAMPPQEDLPQDEASPLPNDRNDGEQNFFGFLVDDSGPGSDFSGGSFSGGTEGNSLQGDPSRVLKAKLLFDPYGFYTSLGNFLVASPQVLKLVGEKGVSLFANFVPKLSILPLLVIIVTSIISFLKIPALG